MNNKKKFTNILLKNLILMAIPQLMILTALLFTVISVRKHNDVKVFTLDDIHETESYFIDNMVNVIYETESLKPAGFDQITGEKMTGQYFYEYKDGRLFIVLLKEETANKVKNGEKISFKVKIIKDTPTADYILSEYATTLGLENAKIEGAVSPYILDETKFPGLWIKSLKCMHYVLVVVLVILLAYILVASYNPALNRQARQLKKYGKPGKVVRRIDKEMRKKLLYRSDNIYVTESFLIVVYVSRIDIIYLDDVKYISKNKVEIKKGPFGRKRTEYQLTLSNVEKMYFEMTIPDEQTIDDIIYYIRGDIEMSEDINEKDDIKEEEMSYDSVNEEGAVNPENEIDDDIIFVDMDGFINEFESIDDMDE